VVSELGVADEIGDEPVSSNELAASCHVDPSALDRVLRLLSTHGVFDREDGGYGHTPASRLLRDDHPMSMRAFAQMMGLDGIWGSLQQLRYSVETGKPGMEKLESEGAWAYLQDRPAEAEVFARAMTAKAGADITAVLATYDFTPFHRIADIGGGGGHLLRAVLNAAPEAEGILFDLPIMIDSLTVDDEPRLTAQAGEFFVDALPAADAYLLMDVLHDWPDEQCVRILTAIRRAAPASAVLLIIEDVIPEGRVDARASTLDIIMLAVAGGASAPPASSANSSPAPGSASTLCSTRPAHDGSCRPCPSSVTHSGSLLVGTIRLVHQRCQPCPAADGNRRALSGGRRRPFDGADAPSTSITSSSSACPRGPGHPTREPAYCRAPPSGRRSLPSCFTVLVDHVPMAARAARTARLETPVVINTTLRHGQR
jgi:hypothetical protein